MGAHTAAVTDKERRVLDRIEESELVDLTQRLVRASGQNPPGEEAATAGVRILLE